MKKLITILLLATCINSVVGQDVKIKKGEILIDKQAVAVIKKEKDQYVISDTSGSFLYQASIKSITPKGRETSQKWIELVNKDNKVHEIELKLMGDQVKSSEKLKDLIDDGIIEIIERKEFKGGQWK